MTKTIETRAPVFVIAEILEPPRVPALAISFSPAAAAHVKRLLHVNQRREGRPRSSSSPLQTLVLFPFPLSFFSLHIEWTFDLIPHSRQEALHSAELQLFHSEEGFFYFHGSKSSVLFRKEKGKLHATMTRSTKGLRSALKEHGVIFEMPLFDIPTEDLGEDTTEESLEERKETLEDLQFFTSLNPRKT